MKKTMWGGRFKEAQHDYFKTINDSIEDDKFLAIWDIKTSLAHAKCLLEAEIIDQGAYQSIVAGLNEIAVQFATNSLQPQSCDEDIHMWIERLLTEKIGTAGKKLHTGRSRNDQVATTIKLWLKDAYDEHLKQLKLLIEALVKLSKEQIDTLMPGCTHLQIAQPISFAFYLTAYAYKLKRDYQKGCDLFAHLDTCPLGSGALAGSNYPLSRELSQSELGFAKICYHAMDAISDRDYIADYLYFGNLIVTHLSQMSEDFIIWQSPNYKYITLSDAFTSGSSLMPQKKNPDALELIRGKAAVMNSRLNGMFGIVKGLPMSYNKDLQEDKRLVYSAYQDLTSILAIMPHIIETTSYHADAMKAALKHSYSNATSLADTLVMKGVPFREAHHIAGQLVAKAIEEGKELYELDLAELKIYCPSIDEQIRQSTQYYKTIENKKTLGSTNKKDVLFMIADLAKWLKSIEKDHMIGAQDKKLKTV